MLNILKASKKVNKMDLFFGDSITSAENNNFDGYVEKLKLQNFKNYGVSGTCIGDYSLYPVEDTNLIQLLYKKRDEIKNADRIFIEYGSNDISSIICEYTTLKVVMIEFVKCIDYIRQNNPSCEIYFISLGDNLSYFAKGQIEYLKNEYFKNISDLLFIKDDLIDKWIETYDEFISYISKMNLKKIEMPTFNDNEFDIDGIHPNDIGYSKISNKLKEILKL